MKQILKLNEISPVVDSIFKGKYELVKEASQPIGIMLRSFEMKEYNCAQSVLCVARAGAGVNNIPLDRYANDGIVVFNTPGANANAVKELVITAMLLAGRQIVNGINWTSGLVDGETNVAAQVEKGKGKFVGGEILNKTVAVYGLGAIGLLVANAASALGMKVKGYDPFLSDANKAKLCREVKVVSSIDELLNGSDFITLHVPLNPETKEFINAKTLAKCKDGVSIINAARGELVCDDDIIAACKEGKVNRYVTDFPNAKLLNKTNIITIPHLGASTPEAEDNCAEMAATQMIEYIEKGNIVNSVNFPSISTDDVHKTIILHKADAETLEAIKKLSCNCKTVTKTNKNFGVTITSCNEAGECAAKLKAISGVIKVRTI